MTFSVNAKTGKVKTSIPAKIGDAIDMVYMMRVERMRLDGIAEEIRKAEYLVKEELLKRFGKQQLDGAKGKVGSASAKMRDIPQFEDDAKFYAYLKKTGDFDLLQRRLNESAVKERWEAGKKVPGLKVFRTLVVNISKASKK